ncbi:hypothetical protein KL907_001650 [Ogataea polymorpha]|nr:hypothetical protein KL907_001650 [Ogataea polymorpha]
MYSLAFRWRSSSILSSSSADGGNASFWRSASRASENDFSLLCSSSRPSISTPRGNLPPDSFLRSEARASSGDTPVAGPVTAASVVSGDVSGTSRSDLTTSRATTVSSSSSSSVQMLRMETRMSSTFSDTNGSDHSKTSMKSGRW